MVFVRNFFHPSRNVDWGGETGLADVVHFLGTDLTSSAFFMSFATARGAPPLIDLGPASAGVQGVSVIYDPAYIHPSTYVPVGASVIRPQINAPALKALPWGDDPAADLVLHYDLVEQPAAGLGRVVCFGTLTIGAGVNI